jgi:F-type H+-transporting ATPase subunit a
MDLKEILEHHIIDHAWNWVNLGPLQLPLSKHLLMMLIASFIMLVLFPLIVRIKKGKLMPFKIALEAMFIFIREDIVIPNLGKEGLKYLPYFSTLFFFILICNLLGMVPFGASATGNIAVTASLAISTFVFINFAGIREQGFGSYIKHIVPAGVPGWLFPLLFPIEIIGLVTKSFALCIRLFANMIAGHIVILSFMGLIFMFGAINPWLGLGVTAPVSVVMILFVSCLELFVSFLQAYIFTFLTAIFVGGAMNPH